MSKQQKNIKIGKARGRPMLSWVGKRPLTSVKAYPSQHIESYQVDAAGFEPCTAYADGWISFDRSGMKN